MARRTRRLDVVFTCEPFTTHVRPHQPWIERLTREGHNVLLATPEKMAATLRTYNLRHYPAGQDWTANRGNQARLANTLIRRGNDAFSRLLYGEYMAGMALSMARDILALARTQRIDAIITDCSEFGGYLAAEVLQIPTLSSDNGLARQIFEYHDGTIRPTLDRAREALGLGPEPRHRPGSFANLATPAPRSFLLGDLDIPGLIDYRHVNPRRQEEHIDPWYLEGDVPFVYAMLGSSGWAVPEMAPIFERPNRVVLEALAGYPCRAMLSVGHRNLEKYPSTDNVRVVGYAPQPEALAAADGYVGHGGFGGLREAIAGLTPMVLWPHFADQPTNAGRVADLRLGITLDPRHATPQSVRAALDELFDHHRAYTRRIARVQRDTQALPTLESILADFVREVSSY
jgi:UDP:flavonoid glycosyltransferase YjiC (YdhE family)